MNDIKLFLEGAVQQRTPGSKLAILKSIAGGHSSAVVLLADITIDQAHRDQVGLSGQYIIKIAPKVLGADLVSESSRHHIALSAAPEFAAHHIPLLVDYFEDGKYCALLYEVAGLSLTSVVAVEP